VLKGLALISNQNQLRSVSARLEKIEALILRVVVYVYKLCSEQINNQISLRLFGPDAVRLSSMTI